MSSEDDGVSVDAMIEAATETKGAIPYDRFVAVVKDRNALKKELAAREQAVTELQAGQNDMAALQRQLAELQARYEGDQSAWADERALYQAGVTDPKKHSVARALYADLDGEDRPGFVDFVQGLREDPTVGALFGGGPPEAPRPKSTPKRSKVVESQPDPSGPVTADALRRAKEHGIRTNDWSRFRELSAQFDSEQRPG